MDPIIFLILDQNWSRSLQRINKCSRFPTSFHHNLQNPSEYLLCLSSDSLFTRPWNSLQLKSLHFRGNNLFTKLCKKHFSYTILCCENFCSQYDFKEIIVLLFDNIILDISFEDNSPSICCLPFVKGI